MSLSAKPIPASAYPTVGTIINGKYQIEQIIGEGGVGIVVSAQNLELGDRVALKFLRAEMLDRSDVVSRFMFEAKAASTIKCDHSATVYDVGRTQDGIPFLVMEFLEGRDLATVIEHGPLDVRDCAEFAMHTCEALAAAHAKGIVHRDIKPENLFIEQRSGMRSIKVLDFGISKTALTGSSISSLLPMVQTQNLMGTPLYMSPEQIRAPENVDARTDIYSLGVVMYEALTCTLPIVSESITELCAQILEQPPTPISKYRPDLPAGLVDVINKCLAKEQKDRYQNAAEVALALMPYAPKRARICAERAGEVLVAAGLVSPESVRFASEAPTSLASGSHPSFHVPPHSKITPIGMPHSSLAPGSSGSLAPSHGAVVFSAAPQAPANNNNKKLIIAAAALVLGLGGGAFALMQRGSDAPKTVAAPPATTETVPTGEAALAKTAAPVAQPKHDESVQDAPTGSAAAEAAKSAAPANPTTAAANQGFRQVSPPTYVPPPRPAARPTAPASPGTPSAKKADSLDIGY